MSDVVLFNSADRRWGAALQRGTQDIVQGFRRRQLWMYLGVREVRKQYQRSVLGPFWLTLNMGILVGALGWFYAQIFEQDIRTFIPYVTLGFIFWGMIAGFLTESCTVFTSAAGSIRQTPLPFSIYAYQVVWRQIVILGHNMCIYVFVAMVFGIWPGTTALLVLPGIFLLIVNGFFLSLILGPLAARFRDIPPIMASFTQILFFLTPVFWMASTLPERALFVYANPFFHFLEIVRQPLLGQTPTMMNWSVVCALTVANALVSVLFYSRFRSKIPYWA